ncbi:hypothetical protein FRACYDRAFT_248084 [Fragilariopsis cylindrus CCMP1102]|uniref:Uncharacterized protein n=1 Tax=Fragilariopsis cylindrus CCMP1102 TaxID=635003 RepID=A0A1E7EVK1_9STRA|nr:hypothetical protein FRACYDRAFT_248084 [Fragilariopsis cylindrus CCMP1102]|eukprot:OEU09825.1 hypothetical protein FRACYDRAFT_248084 [Fragilariopsis cylindrus CCMP1102]
MARTAATNKQTLTALEEYSRLPDFRKRLTWLYYRGEETHNREGLNGYDVPGSATDFLSCGTIKDYIVKSTFRYWAKKAAALSSQLHEQGSEIVEPDLPPKKRKGASKEDESESEYESEGQVQEDIEEDYNSEIESETESIQQEVSFATMPTKKPPIGSPQASSMKKAPAKKKLDDITGAIGAPIANGIAAPIVQGEFLSRCRRTRKRFNHYHIRILWNNYVAAEDIMFEWKDKHTLKVVIYDPIWWSDPEYQAAFDAEHGKESNLIESMIDFQEERKEKVPGQDAKRTGNSGYFTFGEPMSIKEEDDTSIMPKTITHKGIDGMYIVIKVRVAPDSKAEEESTPRKAKNKDDDMGVTGGEAEEVRPPTKQYVKPPAPSQPPAPPLPIPDPQANSQLAANEAKETVSDSDVSNSNSDGDWSNDSIQVDEQKPVSSLQVAAKDWKKEEIDGLPDGEEEVDDNKDLPEGY